MSPFDARPPHAELPLGCDPRIVQLHRYWLGIRPAPDKLPGRQHFDPVAIPQLLRWLFLVDVVRDPLRFRYRLVGSEHVALFGRDTRGEWLDETHPSFASSTAYPVFASAADGTEISLYRGPPVLFVHKRFLAIERLLLPLARNGRQPDILLGITIFTQGASA